VVDVTVKQHAKDCENGQKLMASQRGTDFLSVFQKSEAGRSTLLSQRLLSGRLIIACQRSKKGAELGEHNDITSGLG